MTATREEVRKSIFDLTHYWDDTYGVGQWGYVSQKELDNCSYAVKVRKMLNDHDVISRDKSLTVTDDNIKPFKKMSSDEKDEFITKMVDQGKTPKEIAEKLGYSDSASVYQTMRRLHLDFVIGKPGNKSKFNLNKEMILDVYHKCVTYPQMAEIIKRDYGTDCTDKAIANYMDYHGMHKEMKDMSRRRHLRYLVKDGKTIVFSSLKELAKYLGMTTRQVANQQTNKHPKFKVLTWMDRFG